MNGKKVCVRVPVDLPLGSIRGAGFSASRGWVILRHGLRVSCSPKDARNVLRALLWRNGEIGWFEGEERDEESSADREFVARELKILRAQLKGGSDA